MKANPKILCISCNVEAKALVSGESGEIKEIICPECDESESYEEFKEMISATMLNEIRDSFSAAFRGSQGITYTPGPRATTSSKFRMG